MDPVSLFKLSAWKNFGLSMSAVSSSDCVPNWNHCSGCGGMHSSPHFHVIDESKRQIVIDRFPGLARIWSTVGPKTVLRLCCLWFADGHNSRIHDVGAWLAAQEPRADAAPRSSKRISTISVEHYDSHDDDGPAATPKKAKVAAVESSSTSMVLKFRSFFV